MSMIQDREILEKPYFKIKLNGEPLPLERHLLVKEVEVDEIDEKADIARIVFEDRRRDIVNDSTIIEEIPVEIEMGHKGGVIDTKFKGKINSLKVDFGASGVPEVVMKCIDESGDMHGEKKSNNWEEKTKSAVAEEVIKNNGFTPVIEASENEQTQEVITQDNETDMQFLKRLAEEEGYHTYRVTENFNKKEFYWGKSKEGDKPQGVLSYGIGDTVIIGFKPDFHPRFLDSKSSKEDVNESNPDENTDAEKDKDARQTTGEGGDFINYEGERVSSLPRNAR